MGKNDDIELKLKRGWEVELMDDADKANYQGSYTPPFMILSSRFKDPTDKGLSKNLWEEHAVIEDSNSLVIPKEISIYDLYIIKK